MSDANIVPFQFEDNEIRVVIFDEQPWWVLADVCRILEISNPRDAAGRLEDDEKNTVALTDALRQGRGNPNVTVINEPGLYRLVMRSDKPQAKRFQRWVFHEVLPELRKTGSYAVQRGQSKFDAIRLLVDAAEEHEKRLTRVEGALENLGANDTHRTIKAHAAFLGIRLTNAEAGDLGKKAKALSLQRGYAIGTQPDDNYFTVNKYHLDILDVVFAAREKGAQK
jgi:prophage antirepressor-like protein